MAGVTGPAGKQGVAAEIRVALPTIPSVLPRNPQTGPPILRTLNQDTFLCDTPPRVFPRGL